MFLVLKDNIFAVDVDGDFASLVGNFLLKGLRGEGAEICSESADVDTREVSGDLGLIELGSRFADVKGDEFRLVIGVFISCGANQNCVVLLGLSGVERFLDSFSNLIGVLLQKDMED